MIWILYIESILPWRWKLVEGLFQNTTSKNDVQKASVNERKWPIPDALINAKRTGKRQVITGNNVNSIS